MKSFAQSSLAFLFLLTLSLPTLALSRRSQEALYGNQGAGQSPNTNWYTPEFLQALQQGAQNDDLKGAMNRMMQNHVDIGYFRARVFLMGEFYLHQNGNSYSLKDVYCDREIMANEFPGKSGIGPNKVPDDTLVNTEHTWPQSRFNSRISKDVQKDDLHHLYPTNSVLNGIRGNNKFGEVTKDIKELQCRASRFGYAAQGRQEIFEPPKSHQGNVARALFYFSVKNSLPIDQDEEDTLRRWDRQDPVDQEEMDRNNEIEKLQKSRNPFIDYPGLADRIQNF